MRKTLLALLLFAGCGPGHHSGPEFYQHAERLGAAAHGFNPCGTKPKSHNTIFDATAYSDSVEGDFLSARTKSSGEC